MKANTSSYDVVDKCSPKQQICDNASISFMVRKNWAYTPTASGSYSRLSGWQAVRRNPGEFEKIWKISTGKTNEDIYFVNICAMLL